MTNLAEGFMLISEQEKSGKVERLTIKESQ